MPGLHQVEGIDIGLGRRHQDVGVGTIAIDDAPGLFQAHGDFALGVGALGDGVDRVQLQAGLRAGNRLDGLEGRVHRTGALRGRPALLAIDTDHDLRVRHFAGFARHFQAQQLEVLGGFGAQAVGNQRLQVFVEDLVLLVGQLLETGKGGVQFALAGQDDTQLLQPRTKRRTPGMFAHDHLLAFQPTDSADMIS